MVEPYRILVTGSRTFKDFDFARMVFAEALPAIEPGRDYVFVHGDCSEGLDAMVDPFCQREAWWVDNAGGALYAEAHPVTRADWDRCAPDCDPRPQHRRTRRDGSTYCPAAALRRDAHMVDLGADICLAFIDPCAKPKCRKPKPHGSHGATYTADLAEKAGIPTRRWTS